jgi:hypothetical protein
MGGRLGPGGSMGGGELGGSMPGSLGCGFWGEFGPGALMSGDLGVVMQQGMQVVFRGSTDASHRLRIRVCSRSEREPAEALSSVTFCACVANGRVRRRMTPGMVVTSSFFAASCATPRIPARSVQWESHP